MANPRQKTITSFEIDHDTHPTGMHLSKQQEIKGVTVYTYDLRFKLPNSGDYLSYPAIHSIEHLLAVTLRDTPAADNIIYFGPMGCRTGFYMLTCDIALDEAKQLLIAAIEQALTFNTLPGNSRKECGNYQEHDLSLAQDDLVDFFNILTAAA